MTRFYPGKMLVFADGRERVFFAWDRGDCNSMPMPHHPEDGVEQALLRLIRWEDACLGCARTLGMDGVALLGLDKI
jgi:hypothetical protein